MGIISLFAEKILIGFNPTESTIVDMISSVACKNTVLTRAFFRILFGEEMLISFNSTIINCRFNSSIYVI